MEEEKKSPETIKKAVTKLRLKYQNASLDECEKGMEETHSQLLAQNARNERLKKALQISTDHRTGDAFRFEEMRRQKDEKAKSLTAEQILWKAKHPYLSHESARHEVLDKTRERFQELEGRSRRRRDGSKSPKDDYEALQREMDRARREERDNREREERIRKFNARELTRTGRNKTQRDESPVEEDRRNEKAEMGNRDEKRSRVGKNVEKRDGGKDGRERRSRHRDRHQESERSRNKENKRYERRRDSSEQRKEEKNKDQTGSRDDQRKRLKERRLREAENETSIRLHKSQDNSESSEEGAIKESEDIRDEKSKRDENYKRDEKTLVIKHKTQNTESHKEKVVREKPKKVIDRGERWAGGSSKSKKHRPARY